MRRSHHAIVVTAMGKSQRVPEFVYRFLQKARLQQLPIGMQPIEFLAQAKRRHYRALTVQLSFAEDKCQNGDIQVARNQTEQPCPLRKRKLSQLGQNTR